MIYSGTVQFLSNLHQAKSANGQNTSSSSNQRPVFHSVFGFWLISQSCLTNGEIIQPSEVARRPWPESLTLQQASFPLIQTHTGSDRDKGVQEKRGGILYHTLTHYRLPLLPHIQLGLFIWDIALYPRCSIDFCHFQTVGHDCSLVPFCFYKLTLMPL